MKKTIDYVKYMQTNGSLKLDFQTNHYRTGGISGF